MVIGQLTKEQFLEWNVEIQKLKLAEESQQKIKAQHLLMEKELEILKLKILLHREKLVDASKAQQFAHSNYEEVRSKLEENLGVELKDCAIDELTLEIKKLD